MIPTKFYRALSSIALLICCARTLRGQQGEGPHPGTTTVSESPAASARRWRNYAAEQIASLEAQNKVVGQRALEIRDRIKTVSKITLKPDLEPFLAGLQRTRARSLDEKGRLATELNGATALQRFRLQSAITKLDAASDPLAGQILDIRDSIPQMEKAEAARLKWVATMTAVADRLDALSALQKTTLEAWKDFAATEAKREQAEQEIERQQRSQANPDAPGETAGTTPPKQTADRPDICNASTRWSGSFSDGTDGVRIGLVLELFPANGAGSLGYQGGNSDTIGSSRFSLTCRDNKAEAKVDNQTFLRLELAGDGLRITEFRSGRWWRAAYPPKGFTLTRSDRP